MTQPFKHPREYMSHFIYTNSYQEGRVFYILASGTFVRLMVTKKMLSHVCKERRSLANYFSRAFFWKGSAEKVPLRTPPTSSCVGGNSSRELNRASSKKKTLFTSWWITVQPSATIQRTVPFLPKFWCMYTSLNLRHKTSNKRYVTQRTNIDQTFIQRWGMHISRSEHNGAPVMTLRVNSSADGTLLGSLGNSCIKYNRVNSKRTPWYSPVPCTWAISCNICCYSNPHQQIKS